ncbi:hypothetical protein TB1_036123 [Malus domestica]
MPRGKRVKRPRRINVAVKVGHRIFLVARDLDGLLILGQTNDSMSSFVPAANNRERDSMASVAIPQQKLYDGVQFPVVISPTPTPAAAAIPSLTKTIQADFFLKNNGYFGGETSRFGRPQHD